MANKKHNQLKQAVLDALGAFVSDTSVSPETTLEGLEEIEERVQSPMDALREDINRKNE
jgi:hypothetical protein